MGSIYKRGETYWIKYYKNGKPYRETTKSEKEADAKRLLKKREGEIANGKLPGVYFDKVTFDELVELLLADYRNNNRKSMMRIEFCIDRLKESFEGMCIVNIDSRKIQAYIEKRLSEKVTNGTINRELSAYKRMLTLGSRCTPPKVDKIPYIQKLKENPPRKGFFEHGDFLALQDKLPEHLQGPAVFGYKTGWRLSEIASLMWSQVDLFQGVVILNPGKTKNDEGRTVYLDQELLAILKGLWEDRKHGTAILPWVFLNEDGTDRIRQLRRPWQTACKRAKIGNRLFHDLRRTAVRNMIRSGIPERVAMMISGHKTRSVFDRYNIVSDTDLKLAAQKQETYLKSQMGTISGTIHELGKNREAIREG
jgi:integrase